MFDFNIIEVFSTIGVGLASAILLAYFYFLFCKYFFIHMHNQNAFLVWFKASLEKDYTKTGHALVTLILIYGLGILIQDITDYMTDSDENKNPVICAFQKLSLLDREGELRRNALFKNEEKMTHLGKEIMTDSQLLKTAHLKNAVGFHDIGAINGIYYTSKNWAYLHAPPVREELQSIQNRVDFTRSIYVEAFISLILIVVFFLAYIIKELARGKKNRFTVKEKDVSEGKFFFPRLSLIVLIPILIISRYCYIAAENNFNERAFGYYVSHFRYAEDDKIE